MKIKSSSLITKQSTSKYFIPNPQIKNSKKMSTILKYINNKLNQANISKNISKGLSKEISHKSFASKSTGLLSKQSSLKAFVSKSNCLNYKDSINNTCECIDSPLNSISSFKECDINEVISLKEENVWLKEELKVYQSKLNLLQNTAKICLDEDMPVNRNKCPKPMNRAQRCNNMNKSHHTNDHLSSVDYFRMHSINELTLTNES